MTVTIKKQEYDKLLNYAISKRPEEACGLVLGSVTCGEKQVTEILFIENTDHSSEHFTISPSNQLLAIKYARANKLEILGNWHSHPFTPSRMSDEDLRLAVDKNASYLILSLADINNPVLNSFSVSTGKSERENLIII
jgi:proteasome lid subunit RPN8/RPN11